MKVQIWTRPRVRTHENPCGMLPARCALRSAAHRPHKFSCVRTRGRVHNTFTQLESEIAVKFIAPLVEMQRKFKYVQLGDACGARHAACGKVWTDLNGSWATEWAPIIDNGICKLYAKLLMRVNVAWVVTSRYATALVNCSSEQR